MLFQQLVIRMCSYCVSKLVDSSSMACGQLVASLLQVVPTTCYRPLTRPHRVDNLRFLRVNSAIDAIDV